MQDTNPAPTGAIIPDQTRMKNTADQVVFRQSNAKELPSLMPVFLNLSAQEIRQLFLNLFNESPEFAAIVNNAWQTWDAMRALEEHEPEGTLQAIQEVGRANPDFLQEGLRKLFGVRFADVTEEE